jgi:hypothetical protein
VAARGDGMVAHGLVQSAHVPPRPGVVKIVWRVTGTGPLHVRAVGPDGAVGRLAFGPERHSGSNFTYPGGEWGTGIRFTRPGCWQVRLSRGNRAVRVSIGIAGG